MSYRRAAALVKGSFLATWSRKEYRALLLVMLLAGVSVSSYVPLVTLFLVEALGVGYASAGLFTLTFLAAAPVGLYVGRLSDCVSSRVPLIAGTALWLALGRLAMGLAPNFATALAVGVVFGAFVGVLNAQVFAVLKDVFEREGEEREATVASTVRTGYSLGWALGPVLGSLLAGWLGYHVALAATAVFLLTAMLPLRGLDDVGRARSDRQEAEGGLPGIGEAGARRFGSVALWVFGLACLLALTGETVRLAYLPILAVDRLGIGLGLFGALVAVAPVAELVAMPSAGMLADRWGLGRVFLGGLAVGALGFWAFATSEGAWGLLAGQLLNACFIAVVFGLGVTYAQRLSPGEAGFAASVFFGAQSVSALTGGLAGSGGVRLVGLPGMFFLPASLCAVACLLFAWNDRRRSGENE